MTRALIVAIVCSGCVNELDPTVGALLPDSCVPTDSDPERAVSFAADIEPLLAHCRDTCHSPQGENPIGFQVGKLDLSTYRTLRVGGLISGAAIVVDGDPCRSVLYRKLTAAPPFGDRMPLDGPPFLEPGQLLLVHDWIAEGARE